ncbi:MAG: tetratricopeptide repeat protein [Gammaproteobacteria bacterium]|nr:tetratricopeptide repeat protein [Gammaproteobacteria bacterium]
MEKTSLFTGLWERRVPHAIGVYIAATWMAIEIGDWVIERFLLAPEITSYIFIAMLAFLPAVILMAYQYGKKGRDPWHKSTFIFVPLNLIIAGALPIFLVQPVKASEVKTAVDETGQTQEYVVPKQQYQKRIVSYFWQTDNLAEDEQWLQYAAPWLLSKDLERNEFIASLSAFEHSHIYNLLNEAGYESGLGEPLSLQIKTTRNHSREYFLTGSIDKLGDNYFLSASLHRAVNGKVTAKFSVKNSNLFAAVDEMSEAISSELIGFATREKLSDDLPVTEHVVANMAALEATTKSLVYKLKNPYDKNLVERLEQAYELDPTSIELQKLLFLAYQSVGKMTLAESFGEKILNQSFKLTRAEKFQYQGYLYRLKGDYAAHLKVLALWVELYPNSADAHSYLAQFEQAYAGNLEVAEKSLLKVIELLPNDMGAYYRLARLYESMGELDKAIASMQQAIDLVTDDISVNLYLAMLYEQKGLFDKAKDVYQKVAIIDPSNDSVKYFLALNYYKTGDFAQAKSIVASELDKADIALNRKASWITLVNQIHVTLGEIKTALGLVQSLRGDVENLPRPSQIQIIDKPEIQLLAKLGDATEQELKIKQALQGLEPPYTYTVEYLMLGVYKARNDQAAMQRYIDELESLNEGGNKQSISPILDYAYLTLYEANGDYANAKERAYLITERAKKTANGLLERFSYLNWKVELARLYRLTEQHHESEMILMDVLKEFPASVLAKKELVALYILTDRIEEARALDKEIMQTWNNSDASYVEFSEYLKLREKLDLPS